MMRPPPLSDLAAGIARYRDFSDIDDFATFLPEKVKLTQLTCHPFACRSTALWFEAVRFNFNRMNCKLYAVGDKCPKFLTFTLILHGDGQPVVENDRLLSSNYLFGFDPDREANLIFPGNATHCAVHVRQDVFETCAETMDRLDLTSKFIALNHVYVPESLPPLRSYLNRLYALLQQQSPLLGKSDFQELILRDFLPLLIAALPVQREPMKPHVKAFRRSHLVKQANEYMQDQIDQPLTLTDVCHALGTSSRALSYGFQEIFGMSPMSYLKTLRLQSVYRALKMADSETQTITEIAAQFGFYHLGYFAQDYKQMFGELPSETLKR